MEKESILNYSTPELLSYAQKNWSVLSQEKQFQVLENIIDTQEKSLRQTYTHVNSISLGFRSVKGKIVKEPCLGFILKRKLKKLESPQLQAKIIPKRILHCVVFGKKQWVVAVPTDVQSQAEFKLRPHSRYSQIQVRRKNSSLVKNGAFSVLAQMPGQPKKVFAISCRHVLTIGKSKTAIFHKSKDILIGELSKFIGKFNANYSFSLDATLALIHTDKISMLKEVLRRPNIPLASKTLKEIRKAQHYIVLTPRGEVRVRFVAQRFAFREIPYPGYPKRTIIFRWLIETQFVNQHSVPFQTIKGDSGSPVINASRTRYVGMHIAGGKGRELFIPSTELTNPKNYLNVAVNAPIKLRF